MELSRQQQILARLYTDHSFRERFFSDPFSTGAELGLSRVELDRLADLSGAQVEFFASSLVRKRMNEVRKMLPLSSRVLGRTFERLFRLYAETRTLEAHKSHQRDALNFTIYLQKGVAEYVRPSWAIDVARYEAAFIEVIGLGRRWAVRWFRYPIRNLIQSQITRDGVPPPAPRPSLAIWFRLSHGGKLRHFSLDLSASCFHLLKLTAQAARIWQEKSGARS